MRKSMTRITAMALCLGMLTGCTGKDTTIDTAANGIESEMNGNEEHNASSDGIEQLKLKYAGGESVEYAEPLYNLPKDYNFVFDNLSEAFMEQDEWECFKVFYDSNLEENSYVDVSIEKDFDNNSITIAPNLVFSFEVDEGMLEDGTWGSRNKFYLVRYKDLETGNELEKPVVTVFTIANEMNAPTVTQGVTTEGYYSLSWNEVEGADYYEVYSYDDGMQYSELELTTENTTCNYSEFESAEYRKERWEEIYGDTDMADANRWRMNEAVEAQGNYFVVAKSENGKYSGMSNFCYVGDIANQVPRTVSDDFQCDYEGNSALALPAYADVEMLDGSVGNFLIQYHGAVVHLLDDGRIVVEAKMKNLPIAMQYIYLSGMDYDAFLEDAENLKAREDELATKSVTVTEDLNIPYVPDSTEDSNVEEEKQAEPETENEPQEEPETEEPQEEPESEPESEAEEPESEPESEAEEPDNKPEPEEINISSNVEETIFANSALSEWIARNMLSHKSIIALDGFNEASDSDYLMDAVLEAYNQNPLIGIISRLDYEYMTNSLVVEYYLSTEETEFMQTESLEKASEIASEITDGSMSVYEKEEAINQYLIENASYNDEIMEYINEDGTISDEAVIEYANSFTPYGVLCENLGVCESYAEAFLLIARAAGVDAIIETGKMENVNHEWNRVNIDGAWYSLDITNNDRDFLPNCYFNLPDEIASSILVEDDNALLDSFISAYTSEGLDNEYYVKKGLYAEDFDEAAQLLASGLEQDDISVVRTDASASPSDVETIINSAIEKAQLESGMYYYYSGVISIIRE